MSSMSFCSVSSISTTGSAGLLSTSAPYLTMGRTATCFFLLMSVEGGPAAFRPSSVTAHRSPLIVHRCSSFLQGLDHRLDGVLRPLLVELVEHLADPGISGQRVVEFLLVEAQEIRTL